jgi:hypothetical protein
MKRQLSVFLLLSVANLSFADDLLRDPTQPTDVVNENTVQVSEYTLNAVFISENSRMAVINDKIQHAGDMIDQYQLTTINEKSVELTGKAGTKVLRLVEEKIKVSS